MHVPSPALAIPKHADQQHPQTTNAAAAVGRCCRQGNIDLPACYCSVQAAEWTTAGAQHRHNLTAAELQLVAVHCSTSSSHPSDRQPVHAHTLPPTNQL